MNNTIFDSYCCINRKQYSVRVSVRAQGPLRRTPREAHRPKHLQHHVYGEGQGRAHPNSQVRQRPHPRQPLQSRLHIERNN